MITQRDLDSALGRRMGQHRADLDALVRIPSVSAPGFDPAEVRRSAEAVRDLLSARGFAAATLLEVGAGAHPAVYAERLDAGSDAPTVLLYAHHDVQPPGAADAWTTPAFSPTERDGRLYGRGAADDKAGILVHVAAVDAWLTAGAAPPVNIKVFIEGEEETGSEHLHDFLAAHAQRLAADVVVVTDSVNWRIGIPSLTYLLRGLIDCEVEISGLDHPLHSGMYGGPIPEPLTALTRLLAGLVDDRGVIAIPGFADDVRRPTPDEQRNLDRLGDDQETFRRDAGLADDATLIGDPDASLYERLWLRPAVTIIGLDATPVATSSNTIAASARARVTVRLAPGQDPLRARDLLCRWLTERVPWGLPVTVTPGAAAGAFVADAFAEPPHPAYPAAARALEAAYGNSVVHAGIGGSIPILQPLVDAFSRPGQPPTPVLLTGVEDPDTRAHGIDESLHLADWRRACLAEALLFAELAEAVR